MNGEPQSIWTRPWRGRWKACLWFGLVAVAAFVVVFCVGFLFQPAAEAAELGLLAMMVSVGIGLASVLVVLFVRWLCCWRNFRRFLFGLACLITLIALFYGEEDWRGARAESRYHRELEAKGESLDYRTFIPPTVPDNENFAMTSFFAPLFDFLPGTQKPRDTNAWQRTMDFAKHFPYVSHDGDWRVGTKLDLGAWAGEFAKARHHEAGETNAPEANATTPAEAARVILEEMKQYQPVLDELRAASQRAHCRFNLYYDLDNPAGILLPHLAIIKGLCQKLKLRAAAELEVGQIDAAARDIDLMLYLTDALKNEPLLISQLVRIADLQLTMQAMWEGFVEHRWSDAQLRDWQARFGRFDFIGDLKTALEAERAWGNRIIDWARDNRRTGAFTVLSFPNEADGWQHSTAVIFRFCPRGWYDLEKLNYNRFFEGLVLTGFNAADRRIFPKVTTENFQGLEHAIEGPHVMTKHVAFSRLLLPAIQRVQLKFGFAQTIADEAIVACALERHRLANGKWPGKLPGLTPAFLDKIPNDVISGEPLILRRTGDDQFILYSVGWNEKDDGGTVVLTKDSRLTDLSEGDWVWFSSLQ